MKKTKGISALIIILILALSAAGVAVSLLYPFNWKNNPPKCCDIPNGGTYYGVPFEIKGVSCCGITGTPMEYTNYMNAAYNFIIYFMVLTIVTLIFEKVQTKRKPRAEPVVDFSDFKD